MPDASSCFASLFVCVVLQPPTGRARRLSWPTELLLRVWRRKKGSQGGGGNDDDGMLCGGGGGVCASVCVSERQRQRGGGTQRKTLEEF